ncbi:MAG: protein-L-isoaspartate(D-aspartate) O-methyltransferase [Pirellulales bacterium]|nr:protein-L-isoaspartate(D-aspartate) O-methyltransferase [Pirellulales bacterium]
MRSTFNLLLSTSFLFGSLCIVLSIQSTAAGQSAKALRDARNRMVDEEIVAAGVKDPRVIQSIRNTPRHEFVPRNKRKMAYYDMALAIGNKQTISPPFIVAYMTEAISPKPTDKVLEIGTGSGYQAAVLSPLVHDVYTIEIVEPLGRKAAKVLKYLKYDNVHTKVGDGFKGWPEHAPYDKIIVTCSPEGVPQALVDQLREGGQILIPVGERYNQTLYLLTKKNGKMVSEKLLPVLFVPMTGEAEKKRRVLPDPANPKLDNGDFEDTVGDEEPRPTGWYYQRQLSITSGNDVPSGKNYVTFTNEESGRGCRALQGFPVDGREVKQLQITMHVRARDVRPGQNIQQLPYLAIVFYDSNRNMLDQRKIGPWRGSFPWQREDITIDVPGKAREAIMRIGLFGGVGEISFDNIELKGITR